MKRIIVLMCSLVSGLAFADSKSSSYSVKLDARDPFVKYKESKPVIEKGSMMRQKLQEVVTIKGIVVLGGKKTGVFNSGMHKVGESFDIDISGTKITIKVVGLDVTTMSATLEVNGDQYKVTKR